MNRARAAKLILGTAFLLGGACSAGGAGKAGQRSGGGTGSTGTGSTGNAGGSGNSGGLGSGLGGGTFFQGTGGTGAGASDGGCQETVSQPEQVTTTVTVSLPLDMFIMYDQSGSMNETVAGNTTKWNAIKTALTGFVQDPASDGIGVGIQYFPLQTGSTTCTSASSTCSCFPCCFFGFCLPGCPSSGSVCSVTTGGDCNVADYANPDVPIQLLPGVAPAIVTSLNNHNPGQGTPTVPALTGAIQYASAYAATHIGDGGIPYRKTIVVLATDGDPNDCSSTVAGVASVAAAGLAGNPSIQTFVIGVGSSLTSLDSIAAAGGTTKALIVDTASNPQQQFTDAMNQIRTVSQQSSVISTPVPCEWVIPPMPAGQVFDASKVSVKINGTNVPYSPDLATCSTVTSDAWYYDDPNAPTKVLLCPNTCTSVTAQTNPTVDVVFGCTTHEVVH